MPVEAELVGDPVDEAAREDAVERGPGLEGPPQHRFVGARFFAADERLRPPRRP